MKYLCQADTLEQVARLQLLESALEEAGIPCLIRNESLAVAMGEIPLAECFPALWILNDADYAKGEEIATTWRTSQPATPAPWICPNCRETLEGPFTSCWKCGGEKA